MSEIETLKSMKIKEKMHGVKMNLGEFLKQVLEGGFFSYSGSLTTPGLLMINKFKNIIFLIFIFFNGHTQLFLLFSFKDATNA